MPLPTLLSDSWEFTLRESPLFATHIGDDRYNDRLDENGPQARERRRLAIIDFLDRARAVDRNSLSVQDRITLDLFLRDLEEDIESYRHRFYHLGVDPLGGPQVWLFRQADRFPFRRKKDLSDFLDRLRCVPSWLDLHLADLREGLAAGRTVARVSVDRVLGQLDGLLAIETEKNPLMLALTEARKAEAVDPADVTRFGDELRGVLGDVIRPALARMAAFLRDEYLPHARTEDVGLWAIPGGSEAYDYLVRHHTTLDRSPEEIHEIGLREVATARRKMQEIAGRHGFGDSIEDFLTHVVSDPANQPATREEVVELARAVLRKIEGRLPEYFGHLPKSSCIVKPIEEFREKDCPAAFYEPPLPGGDGTYWINTHEPPTRLRFNAAALAVHEAIPGHHLQVALTQEMERLPKFRRYGGATAYVEGWALYAEELAVEMGVCADDLDHLGMLTYQAWRSARLVVDTGLHAKRWTREQGLRYYRDNLALSQGEILNEIDRYISMPAQALSYKMGHLEIRALRTEAEERLGDRFDLRAFHDIVLEQGGVPLSILRGLVEEWIAAQS